MRSKILLALAAACVVALSASSVSARPGCYHRHAGLGSDNVTRGINAAQPGKAILNPCSSMYAFGRNVRRMEKRRYPNAIVRH